MTITTTAVTTHSIEIARYQTEHIKNSHTRKSLHECANMNYPLCLSMMVVVNYDRMMTGMGSAKESRRYYVMSSLVSWTHTQNDPCITTHGMPFKMQAHCYFEKFPYDTKDKVFTGKRQVNRCTKSFSLCGFVLEFSMYDVFDSKLHHTET